MNQKIISTKTVGVGGQNGGNSTISSLVMSPIPEVQVSRLFSSLNVQKSSLDVLNKLIKIAAEPLWKTPAHMYNHLIKTGIGLLFFLCIYLNMVLSTSKASCCPIPCTLVTTHIFFILP